MPYSCGVSQRNVAETIGPMNATGGHITFSDLARESGLHLTEVSTLMVDAGIEFDVVPPRTKVVRPHDVPRARRKLAAYAARKRRLRAAV